MSEFSGDIFEQGLMGGKDVYVVEGNGLPVGNATFKIAFFHVIVGEGEIPDETEIAERSVQWKNHQLTAPRLLSYEELAEKQRIRSSAWERAQAVE